MAGVTRTLNPLHFEDLEPHRFEDLVRQLAYDFRDWRSIEAVGRSGSDEGMDIRATEGYSELSAGESEPSEDDAITAVSKERVWVIQCKREKSIAPTKMRKIISASLPSKSPVPYGFILASACDFSKAARDVFHDEVRARGIEEFYLWGKAELEDRLFQPKYDHLLFAYFNVSLAVRRRSLRTDLRSRLVTKAKLVKLLGDFGDLPSHTPVLLRDPQDTSYPRADAYTDFHRQRHWGYYYVFDHFPVDHIAVVLQQCLAYFSKDDRCWDFIPSSDIAIPQDPTVCYARDGHLEERRHNQRRARAYWESHVPKEKRATYYLLGSIPYESILAIDELGDVFNSAPHILLEARSPGIFWAETVGLLESGERFDRSRLVPDQRTRITFFPEALPELDDSGG